MMWVNGLFNKLIYNFISLSKFEKNTQVILKCVLIFYLSVTCMNSRNNIS